MPRFNLVKTRNLTKDEYAAIKYVSEYVVNQRSYYQPHFEAAAKAAYEVIEDRYDAQFIAVALNYVGKGHAYSHHAIQDICIQLLKEI